jgi:DNA-binding LytR/AlgR family response regulator
MGFVKVAEIVSIVSDGDYSIVRLAGGRTHRARKSLREWVARLPENAFARVHRSTIVNLEFVERVEEWSHFSYQAVSPWNRRTRDDESAIRRPTQEMSSV